MSGKLKVAVLISGRGSNMQSLVNACAEPGFPAKIVLVLSNRANAAGLDFARSAGIPTAVVPHGDYPDRAAFGRALDAEIRRHGATFICLAGFMRILDPDFVAAWRDRVLNIHPSLLPAFPGLDTHARAIESGAKLAGCTVHFVREEMDSGPIVVQAAVPVRPDDTPESLAARVLAQEHLIYPRALRLVAEGRVMIVGERAVVPAEFGTESVSRRSPQG